MKRYPRTAVISGRQFDGDAPKKDEDGNRTGARYEAKLPDEFR